MAAAARLGRSCRPGLAPPAAHPLSAPLHPSHPDLQAQKIVRLGAAFLEPTPTLPSRGKPLTCLCQACKRDELSFASFLLQSTSGLPILCLPPSNASYSQLSCISIDEVCGRCFQGVGSRLSYPVPSAAARECWRAWLSAAELPGSSPAQHRLSLKSARHTQRKA